MKIYFNDEFAYIRISQGNYLCIGTSDEIKSFTGDEIQQAIREAVILMHFNALVINKQTIIH